jgi:hypothetical protein
MRKHTSLFGLLAALTACQADENVPGADEAADAAVAPVTAPQSNVNPQQRTLLGTVDLGATVTTTIEVPYHPGASADNVTLSGVDADQFSVEDVECVEGGTCVYTVAFSPDAAGARTALVSLGTGDGAIPLSKLTGVGLPPAILAAQFLVVQKGVDEAAPGRGSVFEIPNPTLSCDADCDATMQTYETGTVVTLRATPEDNSVFLGWSGACSGTTDQCTVTMSGTRAVVARFRGASQLSLQPQGANGVIKSTDGQLSCGTDCSHMYAYGSQVTLSYELPPGVAFANWDGVCAGAGTGPCAVTMNQSTEVSAQFRNIVTASKIGSGHGSATIVSRAKDSSTNDGEINCGADCQGNYATGSQIDLIASWNDQLTAFDGWQGCTTTSGPKCTLTIDGPVTVQPRFRAKYIQRVQVPAGGGIIRVQLGFTQHTCSSTCDYPVALGEVVALRAEPANTTAFERWGGHCAGEPTNECIYDVTGAHTSSATFQHRYRLHVDADWRFPQWRVGNGAWNSFSGQPPYNLDFPSTTLVQLRQTPTRDTANCLQFAGFSGDGNCSSTSCTVTVDTYRQVYGHWAPIPGCRITD